MELKSTWSEVHNCKLQSTTTIERFKRDKDILSREKESAGKGYKQYSYVWSVHFPRASWIVLRNSYYRSAINALNRGKGPLYEKSIETYNNGITSVPFYYAMKGGKKIGNLFLREDTNGDKFLFMPKNGGLNKKLLHSLPVSIGRDGRKNWKSDVSNDYYIFDLNKSGNIKPKANLWYRKRS